MHLNHKKVSLQNNKLNLSKRRKLKRKVFRRTLLSRIAWFFKKTGACIITTLLYTSLTALFLFLFRAESYSIILLCWEFVVSLLIFAVFATSFKTNKSALYIVLKTLLVLFTSSGAIALLVQLGASQRSLAEAWLESTRNGMPFGFFSFFSAQLYAFLLLVAVYAVAIRKYITSVCIALAVNLLCVAIIFANQIMLVLSCIFVVAPLLQKKQWQTFLVPVIVSSIFASLCAFAGVKEKMPTNVVSVDMSEVMSVIAPEFPLMVHIPGYGYSVNSSKPVNSITLSPRTIFAVQGGAFQTIYFTDNRLRKWNGTNWVKIYQTDSPLKVNVFFDSELDTDFVDSSLQRVSVTLKDDFFSIIPIMQNTVAVKFPEKYKDATISATDGDSISVFPTITKGTTVTLFNSANDLSEVKGEKVNIINFTESYVCDKISLLAKSLGSESVTDDSATQKKYIMNVLEYLQDGFTYSLKTPASPSDQDPFEYFLLTSKTGFCTWYAGSFALLMHAAKIPCRVAEGYRVALDAKGMGNICGTNAHSWAEVYIDGAWRIFEPTPIYTAEDPFAYINENDKRTKKLIASSVDLTSSESTLLEQNAKLRKDVLLKNICSKGVYIFVSIVFLILLFAFLQSRSVVQKARYYVRCYKKRGIEVPQEIGWLMWKQQVLENAHTKLDKDCAKKAIAVADELMQKVYCN